TRRILSGGIKIRPTDWPRKSPIRPREASKLSTAAPSCASRKCTPCILASRSAPRGGLRRAMENSPPLRRYQRGLLIIVTYFPQNAGRSQASVPVHLLG